MAVFNLALENDVKGMMKLVEEGVDPHVVDREGESPLYLAISERNLEMTEYLLSLPNVDRILWYVSERDGYDLLLNAVDEAWGSIVEKLLEAGADPNGVVEGIYPLGLNLSPEDIDIYETLISYGADVNFSPEESEGSPIETAIQFRNLNYLNLLIYHGVDLNRGTEYGSTLDYAIAEETSEEIIDTLMLNGISFKTVAPYGWEGSPNPDIFETLVYLGDEGRDNLKLINRAWPLFSSVMRTLRENNADLSIIPPRLRTRKI